MACIIVFTLVGALRPKALRPCSLSTSPAIYHMLETDRRPCMPSFVFQRFSALFMCWPDASIIRLPVRDS